MKIRILVISIGVFLLGALIGITGLQSVKAEEVTTPSALLDLSNLAIPESLGKVDERFQGTSDRWIIHIQDVHAHYAAQENIAAILDHLNAIYGLKTVALEGGWSATSYPDIWGLPSSREKQMLARKLLEEDYITGPSYAAMFSQTPLLLVGIENEELYEKNREIYVEHLSERGDLATKIETIENQMALEKKAVFNDNLKRFDVALNGYREGKNLEEFIPTLIAWAETEKVDLDDLDQITLFKGVMAQEKRIKQDKLKRESTRLMAAFKRQRLSFEELLRSEKLSEEKLQYYPETKKYLELMNAQDAMNHREFFIQIQTAIDRLKEKLFVSEEERALDAKADRFFLAKKIILFQATPDDLKALELQKEALEDEMDASDLGEALQLALDFYDVAKTRDEIFFEKITTDSRLSGDIAIVTGGFHTEGLSEQMRHNDTSYIIITPNLGEEVSDEKLYFKRLQQELPQSQTLADLRDKSLDDRFEDAFMEAMQERDLRKALRIVESYQKGVLVPDRPVEATEPFKTLTPEEQVKIVEDYAQLQKGTQPITVIILASELQKNLFPENIESGRVARTGWHQLLGEKRFTFFVLQNNEEAQQTILGETIGGRARLRRVPGDDVQKAIQRERSRFPNKIIAVVDPNFQTAEALVVPPHPAIWFVIGPYAEYGDSRISAHEPGDLAILEDLLLERYRREGVLKAA